MARYYNQYHSSVPVFNPGNEMFLDSLNIYLYNVFICQIVALPLQILYGRKTSKTYAILPKILLYCYGQCLLETAWRRAKGMMTRSAVP